MSEALKGFDAIRAAGLGNDTAPALVFNPVPPGKPIPKGESSMAPSDVNVSMPSTDEELAFLPTTHLARLVARRDVKPTELTKLYLARLKKYDPELHCVVNLTEDIAMKQAKRADEEDRCGHVSRTAPRHPVGRERSSGRARHEDDLGRYTL